jgi:hypothetical protein
MNTRHDCGKEDLNRNKRYLHEVIGPEIAGRYGVSRVSMFDTNGNASDELQIVVDPYKAAELGIDIALAADRIGWSSNISSDVVDVGRCSYILTSWLSVYQGLTAAFTETFVPAVEGRLRDAQLIECSPHR